MYSNTSMMLEEFNISFFSETPSLTRGLSLQDKGHLTTISQGSFSSLFIFGAFITSIIHYFSSLLIALLSSRYKEKNERSTPPLVSCLIPWIGTIPLGLLWNPREFMLSARHIFWNNHPVRLRLLPIGEIYILQGKQNILSLFRQKKLSSYVVRDKLLRNFFLLPESAIDAQYPSDTGKVSGLQNNRSLESRGLVHHLSHSSAQRFLTGPGYAPFSKRWEENITHRLMSLNIGEEWIHWDNFLHLFHNQLLTSVLDAMCGTTLCERHPQFVKDFWTLDHHASLLFTGAGSYLAPKACNARDRALAAVKDWHSWARKHFIPTAVDTNGDDPFWGTKFFRDRQATFSSLTGFNADAIASHDLAFMWGANTNSIIASFWSTLEVFKDPQLLAQVRNEVHECIEHVETSRISFDTKKLLRQPVMQAIYAETLRLRVNGFIVRHTTKYNVDIGHHTIPQNRFVVTSSTPAHMDPTVWSSGENASHPPEEFWPGRFLKQDASKSSVEFSLAGTEGSWIPFSGGANMCPGRTFTKLEVLMTMALMVTLFDVEILADSNKIQMSSGNFGFGTLSPKEEIPVRIRRRKVDSS